ncbi:MAG: hypothetical protein J6S67_13725 [Methanobrevibacter sp.]|nr:hypothetical protein [Methanobrevibacter sp.]
MEGFSVKIRTASKELSAKERVAIKDTSNCISIDEATTNNDKVIINYDYHVILDIHNEHSDNKDYVKTVVVDKNGDKYVTGSQSFTTALVDIVDEMVEAGEGDNIQLQCYRKDSKNYKGKQFITVSLI